MRLGWLLGTIKAALRRLLSLVFGEYEAYRIYWIDPPPCGEPEDNLEITTVEDRSIFDAPGLPDELSRAAYSYRTGAVGFAAWREGQLAGVCWFWTGPLLKERNIGLQPPDCAALVQLVVAERFRGLGIGTRLKSQGTCRMHELGYRRLYSQVWHSNTGAIRVNQKAGWKQVAWFFSFRLPFLRNPVRIRKVLGFVDPWEASSTGKNDWVVG